jgi:hypothetical protein
MGIFSDIGHAECHHKFPADITASMGFPSHDAISGILPLNWDNRDALHNGSEQFEFREEHVCAYGTIEENTMEVLGNCWDRGAGTTDCLGAEDDGVDLGRRDFNTHFGGEIGSAGREYAWLCAIGACLGDLGG